MAAAKVAVDFTSADRVSDFSARIALARFSAFVFGPGPCSHGFHLQIAKACFFFFSGDQLAGVDPVGIIFLLYRIA